MVYQNMNATINEWLQQTKSQLHHWLVMVVMTILLLLTVTVAYFYINGQTAVNNFDCCSLQSKVETETIATNNGYNGPLPPWHG